MNLESLMICLITGVIIGLLFGIPSLIFKVIYRHYHEVKTVQFKKQEDGNATK